MNLIPLPACQDNSLWLLHDGQRALVVDPGDAGPLDFVPGNGLQLEAILVNHLPRPAEGDRIEVLESTVSKLEFATAVAPSGGQLIHSRQQCEPRRSRGEPCLPSAIAPERSVNPFLRTGQPAVAQAAQAPARADPADPVAVFATLRPWKNEFR